MSKPIKPDYPTIKYRGYMTNLDMVSPFANINAAFNFVNKDFPYIHNHTFWEIILMTQGSCVHTINNNPHTMTRGDAVIVYPGAEHKIEAILSENNEKLPTEHIAFHFSSNVAENIINTYSNSGFFKKDEPYYLQINEKKLTNLINKLIIIQLQSREKYEANILLIINKIFINYIEQCINTEPNNYCYPTWLNNLLQQLNKPSSFNKSVKLLAKDTPYSYSRLSSLFKEYTNMSILEYITETKIKYAARLLKRTDMNILYISTYLGYDSIASFNRNFKRILGVTPSEYRKNKD